MTELERLDQAEELFARYALKEHAVVQNRENQEYLKTMIHDDVYVKENYDMRSRLSKELSIVAGAAGVVFLFVWLIAKVFLVALGIGAFVLIGGSVVFIALNRYRLDHLLEKQSAINEGIIWEIERLRKLEPDIVKMKDDFAKGLEKYVPFISMSEMKYIGELRQSIEFGEADTCEEASDLLEQKLLLQQFTTIMENHEIEQTFSSNTLKTLEDSEEFVNPLESIKPSTKKSLKEKIFGKRLKKNQRSYFDMEDEQEVDPYSPQEIMKYVQAHSKGKKKK